MGPRTAALLCSLALVTAPRPSAGANAPLTSGWSRDFGSHAFDGEIRELLVDGDVLVAVGTFSQTPHGLASGVAVWDGASWQDMGRGPQGVVDAIVVHEGVRVIGGSFALSDAEPAVQVARWDGRRWVPMPSPGGQVRDLAVVGGALYAAGAFPSAPGFHAPAARWTGSDGEPLGAVSVFEAITPSAIAEYGGRLVLGGRFRAGLEPPALVIAWNGSEWDTLARGLGLVRALAVHEGELHAAGSLLEPIEGATGAVIAWNGERWRAAMPAEWTGTVRHLRPLPEGLLVAGFLAAGAEPRRFRLLTVNAEFGVFGSPNVLGDVLASAMFAGRLHVGGDDVLGAETATGDTVFALGVLRLGDGGWETTGETGREGHGFRRGAPDHVWALLAHEGSLYAGGSLVAVRDGALWEPAAPVMRWDGTSWQSIGPGQIVGGVHALAWWDGALVAGGAFQSAPGIEWFANLARWDGARWRPLGAPIDGPVYALLARADELLAGGQINEAGGTPMSGVARWDGATWSSVGGVSAKTIQVRALLDDPSGVVAGGWFAAIGGVEASHVARWDGVAWAPLGEGVTDGVDALAIHAGRIVAGSPGGVRTWDGVSWQPLGAGAVSGVYALESVGDQLYAAGSLPRVGPIATHGIARWNGATWNALESGLGPAYFDGHALALESFQDALYVGGAFGSAGDLSSTLIARWDDPRLAHGAATLALGPPFPAPFADRVQVVMSTRVAGAVTARIHDLAGRTVRVVARRHFDPGEHVLAWDGRGEDGRRQPAGVYFFAVTGGEDPMTRRVLLVR
jgi:trimeric autotransporter adhesin